MTTSLADEIAAIDSAINAFAESMREKMHIKAAAGFRGWDNSEHKTMLRNALQEHLNKDTQTARQMIDVANFAMMLWWISILEVDEPVPPSLVETFKPLREQEWKAAYLGSFDMSTNPCANCGSSNTKLTDEPQYGIARMHCGRTGTSCPNPDMAITEWNKANPINAN